MNFVSLLGLFALLFLAWTMSYHRTQVRLRPVIWGLSLQFLLALIILREGWVSYIGMIGFGSILVAYMLKDQTFIPGNPIIRNIGHGLVGLALGAALYAIHSVIPLTIIIGIVIVFLIANAYFLKQKHLQPWASMSLVVAMIAMLIATGQSGKGVFESFTESVESFLRLADYGANFLFGGLVADGNSIGFIFAFKVLPTIIFFGGFMSVMYYIGVMQKLIGAMSHFMRWTLQTSGSESLSCTANVFVGQTEAPLLVKPFLGDMTKSELLTIMVGGFATIAGGVLAGYVQMGVDAGHLIAASVMSAPAALVVAKIIYPEKENSATSGDVEIPTISVGDGILESAANGITDGLKLALNVGAMLIGFIALIAVVDVILQFLDGIIDGKLIGGELYEYAIKGDSPAVSEYAGIFPGSLQTFFGNILAPLAWLMGVPWSDAHAVGNLLGVKLSLNEFVAFANLGTYIQEGMIGDRAQIVSTYALCGFANFSSIGIQLGGLGALAPERRSDLAKVVGKAMFGGAIASWTTACIAGLLL